MAQNFATVRSNRNKGTSLKRSPQFLNGVFGKLLFHLALSFAKRSISEHVNILIYIEDRLLFGTTFN